MTANQINFAKHKEDVRHNKASEAVASGTLSESVRHNTASEAINWYTGQNLAKLQGRQGELAQAQAAESSTRADLYESEVGTKQQQIDETRRHNIVSEIISGVNAIGNLASGVAKTAGVMGLVK